MINPKMIEGLFATDLAYLQSLYNEINQAGRRAQRRDLSAVPARVRSGAARRLGGS